MNLQIYESEGSVISNMYRNIPVRYVAAMVIGVCRLISSLALARSSSPLAHCFTIFIKSSGYRNIDDCHRNPNINIREIIWLGNQLTGHWTLDQFYAFPGFLIFCCRTTSLHKVDGDHHNKPKPASHKLRTMLQKPRL